VRAGPLARTLALGLGDLSASRYVAPKPMSETPTSVEPPAPPESAGAPAMKLLKGCGCVSGLGALALGILVIGHFDSGAWASALGAIVIGVMVFALSGTNGFWEK
jgi:hypothetical protein